MNEKTQELLEEIADSMTEIGLALRTTNAFRGGQICGLASRLRSVQLDATELPSQEQVLAWAIRSFGPVARNADERAARVAEEAIEIAQVEGVPLGTIKRIADRVYSRPPGERWQEIGGTMIGILSYAEIIGLSMAECTRREFERVLSKPRDWWQKKHAEKVAAGTADLSPADVHPDLREDATPHCRMCGGDHWVGAHDQAGKQP